MEPEITLVFVFVTTLVFLKFFKGKFLWKQSAQITQIITVKIFKTNVRNDKDVAKILTSFLTIYPLCKINFDLDDGDNILRVEAAQFEVETDDIIKHMVGLGYSCEELE